MKICARCIMTDKGDTTITFDENGFCNYCTEALKEISLGYFPNAEGERKLNDLIALLKREGKGKKYDCLMGISGGLDSSYLAYLGYKWKLRILAVHVDDGYDSETAKDNIRKLSKACNLDLIMICPDGKAFNDLTLSYIKASVPNLAVPQDNVLFSALYKYALENDIKYFLSGYNLPLECILQRGNTYCHDDVVNTKAIHKKFGTIPIGNLPLMSWKEKRKIRKKLMVQTICPLNYIDYNKERAIKELKEFCDYNYYEAKHYESIFTRFLQTYYLPLKFNVDKRTSHLSSLVISGQMTRETALSIMEKPPVRDEVLQSDINFIIDKLNITRDEFDDLMKLPPRQHDFYKTDWQIKLYSVLARIKAKIKR